MILGTPFGEHPTRILMLGSGELGKEVTISLMRLGAWVCAADSYNGAPAAQVAHEARVLDMANADALRNVIGDVKPDIVIPEIEAIATDVLFEAEQAGIRVVPSAAIASICMDRERLRQLAADELGLPTTKFEFAGSLQELKEAATRIGFPCVVKPVMSSSGHGQSVVRSADKIEDAWNEAQTGRRAHGEGDVSRVIIEQLVDLDYELTMLTVSSSANRLASGRKAAITVIPGSLRPSSPIIGRRSNALPRRPCRVSSPMPAPTPHGACSASNCSCSKTAPCSSTRSPPARTIRAWSP